MSSPSNFCYPNKDTCPYLGDFNKDQDKDFCIGCSRLVRDNQYDEGTRRTGYLEARVCELDSMRPEVYYSEPEPMMGWE